MDQLATPALVIDAAAVNRNIGRMADYVARHNLALRPHTKTHKSRRLAAMQLAAGARGLTVAKVGEAEVMATASDDLLLAYPACDIARTERLAVLASDRMLRVAVDSEFAAAALGQAARNAGSTIGILVDIEVGFGRTGLQSPAESLTLAQFVDRTPGLRLDGIMSYPGHIGAPATEQSAALKNVSNILAEVIELWAKHGLAAPIVSGGSTPTAFQSHQVKELSEIRPGTYIFNDLNTVLGGFCSWDDCAARVVATVVSNAVPGQIILDAGSKTLTSDRCGPAPDSGYGYIVDYPDARIGRLNEEHAWVDVRACASAPRLGERVAIIPNHICPCVNLHDIIWWQEDGQLEPLPVDARGKLS